MDTITVNPIIYNDTPERPVTRAEIDRLTAIIDALNAARDRDALTIRGLRHEIDAQCARADAAEALGRGIAWALRRRSTND